MFSYIRSHQTIKFSSIIAKRQIHTNQKRCGYIVLVPEIGEDPHAADGIIQPDGLPAFNAITIENCMGAIGAQATAVEKTVTRIEEELTKTGVLQTNKIFREFDEVTGPLDTTWGVAKALYLGNCTLIPTKSYMNIHERARNARASKYNSRTLYNALLKESAVANKSAEEQRLLDKFLLEGKLNGLALSKRDELQDVVSKLSQERASFKNKVSVSISTFTHNINDVQIMRGFPTQFLEATALTTQQANSGPWRITLQPQIVENFLKYCPDRLQRWNIWIANARKASGQTEKSLENSTHLEKIRGLRQQQAKLLGFKNFAEMSMQTKMVGSLQKLHTFFAQLLQHAGPAQSVEIAQLQNFANRSGFEHALDLCDVAYWQRKQLLSEHNFNEQEVRAYFPLAHVLEKLFELSEELFHIKIVARAEAQVWQPAVKYYDVFDASNSSQPIAGFYVDCYSKEHKFAAHNGWMVSIRNRNASVQQMPLCALIFNFALPRAQQYLLSFEELRMLFHTFGTAMQHLLTRVNYTDLAGISNIEWDASQVVGNVMSNFLDNASVLQKISSHVETLEPIPHDLASSGRVLKHHLAGYRLCQQLYLSHLDMELHEAQDYWLDAVKKLWPVYRCMPLDKKDAHVCSMTDIFSGDWAAAYYSHLYAQMIAADISVEFEQNAANYASIGKRFRDTYLSLGGSMPAAEVFRRFRGRDPSVESLLKSLNIHHPTQTTGDL